MLYGWVKFRSVLHPYTIRAPVYCYFKVVLMFCMRVGQQNWKLVIYLSKRWHLCIYLIDQPSLSCFVYTLTETFLYSSRLDCELFGCCLVHVYITESIIYGWKSQFPIFEDFNNNLSIKLFKIIVNVKLTTLTDP